MPSIRLVELSFAYSAAAPLLEQVSLQLESGWTGVVGPNGAGKTTLLRLIAGELVPDAGRVELPPRLRPVLCRQSVEACTPEICAFADSVDGRARRMLGRLGLDPVELERWPSLSPGERKRWQIGAALWADPACLLLDEPTNHLDGRARHLLMAALRGFHGVGLVISHDRELLNGLAVNVLRFHHRGLRLWRGNYDTAHSSWQAERAEQQTAWDQTRDQQQRLRHQLADKRKDHAAAEQNKRTGKRMKGPQDTDARSAEAKGRAAGGEKRAARQVALARRRLERTDRRLASFQFRKDPGRSVFVDYRPAPKPWLFRLDTPRLCAGDTTLLEDLHLQVGRADRIRVAGPNGAGKSTLLRALVSRATVPARRLLSLEQELSAARGEELLRSVRELWPELRGRVLSLVAALGVDPEQLLASRLPSPGETRKLAMAFGLGLQVWGLVLDEPTNHLDLPAIERLEQALASYPGALLVVTHDNAFAASCTRITWQLRDRRIIVES
jgi:ATPase subunit of ABC transporter with duplicated ATPase domains